MKKQLHFITIILILAGTFASWAQTTRDTTYVDGKTVITVTDKSAQDWGNKIDKEIKALEQEKQLYESNQRTALAEQIEEINSRVGKWKNYTEAMAQKDKETVAAFYAEKISRHNEMIDSQIEFAKVKQFSNGEGSAVVADFSDGVNISIKKRNKQLEKNVYTNSGFTLGFGYNYIDGENLGIDDFSYGNNNYFSLGYNWVTALNKSQTLRFKYGIEYQTQGTELNGNRAFTISDPNNTQIERLNFDFDKAKFRQDQLVVPVHFEFSGTDRKEYEDGRVRYLDYDKFKFGIGGYAGFNLSSRLKYKYELGGEDIKQTNVNAFDNNAFVYGLDAYFGKGDLVLFGRLGLNDIFKSGSVDGQYVAFGIRLQ
ncbi:porin family protein [Nonlabens agnitus]|uniref:Outer membrane protein beta-barrel domain-containing protein n=1 Tax=Nonlabens agnitus TaxID=870484 RepID=A0A2S9WQP9_9FLAO|nr:hypothetical protein [Nonlabens agnitus]PRP65616.1 hypothetical protein BST86_00180 [Nonlabens agnitus]